MILPIKKVLREGRVDQLDRNGKLIKKNNSIQFQLIKMNKIIILLYRIISFKINNKLDFKLMSNNRIK